MAAWYWDAILDCGCLIRGAGWPTPTINESYVCHNGHGDAFVVSAGGQNWRL